MEKIQQLIKILQKIDQQPYPSHSRIHTLSSFNSSNCCCFVKREDELGFGISGSKIRKYRTLIPFLIHNKVEEVVVIGSAYSNHVLSFLQLLIENKIQATLFLRGDPKREFKGNCFFTSLLIPASSIHWFSKEAWRSVLEQAYFYAKDKKNICILLEGACIPEAFPGALTLPLDIIQNEADTQLEFNHLFIDSGTGLSAIALILAYFWIGKKTQIHVVLMAENETYFLKQLASFHRYFEQLIGASQLPFPSNFQLYRPKQGKKFGQIYSHSFKDIIQLARAEGFFTDPIYTGKLFHESKKIINSSALEGLILIIHSGGTLSLLAGFQNQLREAFQE
ncbi:Uncharacterized protein PRO82_000401 [Candidatus Protochlamydia amoebophila]|uniref:hypothetical protein n=1 Tax=Candidatus Protochlamydia amoebophila TaxID=362787 RepID=UPI001BCA1D87|nr:hypothetical protein [Candidatus Protochlamydia amoebophila]MBS4163105.1 Uncharacterized protein [Candidatus Protochlamydia amoebophila]